MKFEYDILVNYSKVDDAVAADADQGWIHNFSRFLEMMLLQIMGKEPRILLRSDQEKITSEELNNSCLMVAVLSENFIASGNCLDGLDNFISNAAASEKQDHLRVFKVFKQPLDHNQEPEKIRDLLNYDLYEMDEETGLGVEFFDYFGPGADKNYWMKMVDLAYDIYDSLVSYQEGIDKSVKPIYARKTIYLAETSHDLVVQRNIIRRELQRHGFRVLPVRSLPKDPEQVEKTVRQNLEECSLSIHLLGSSYGDLLPGSERSVVDIQNRVAGEMSGEQQKDTHTFSRLIWINPAMRNVSDRQQAFIENLKRDLASLEGAEILETPLEDFKNIIRQELVEKNIRKLDTLSDETNKKMVYLLYDQIDRDGVKPLVQFIESEGYRVLHPEFDDDLLLMRQHHIERLINFDLAIVFKQGVNDQWVRMKVLDLLKAPGFGRKKPVLGRAVLTAPGIRTDKDLFAGLDVEILQSPEKGVNKDEVLEFLQSSTQVL